MCVICVQDHCLEDLKNPSITEERREELESNPDVMDLKEAIQIRKVVIESFDSQLRGESCPKGHEL